MGMHQMLGPSFGSGADYEIQRSLRFNSADSAYLNRTPSSAGNRKTWTWSGWVKRCGNNNFETIFSAGGSNTGFRTNITVFFYQDDDGTHPSRLVVGEGNGAYLRTNAMFRDPGAWGHLVIVTNTTLSTAADRIKIYWNGVRITDFSEDSLSSNVPQNSDIGYNTTDRHAIGSQSYNSGLSQYASLYLAEIHFVDGQALSPSSFGEFDDDNNWNPIEADVTYGTNGYYLNFSDNSSNAALGTDSSGNSNTWTVNNITAAAVASANTSQTWSSSSTGYHSGAGNAFDGNLTTSSFATSGANANAYVDIVPINASKVEVYISAYGSGSAGAYYYCRQTNGTQHTYTISSSGTSLGWITVYDGSQISINRLGGARNSSAAAGSAQYGWKVDGVLLVNTGTAGFDPTAIDSLVDSPTNYEADSGNNGGNYPTWNPFDNGGALVLSNGNLEAADTNNNQHRACRATQRIPNSGKWYFECTITTFSNTIAFGISTSVAVDPELATSGSRYLLVNTGGNVQRYDGSSWTEFNGQSGLGTGASLNSVLQVAVDQDAGKLWFGLNNVWLGTTTSAAGNPSNGTNPTLSGTYTDAFPVINCVNCAGAVNFGQRGFKYTPPTNFKSLCTQNFPDPPIADGSTVFDVITATGNGAERTFTMPGGFGPDLVWSKSRSSAYNHGWFDTVRGATKRLRSNSTAAEDTSAQQVKSFTSDGFVQGTDVPNTSGESGVYWAWDAGSSTVSNTDGSQTSQVRANPTAGFSIATFNTPDPSANFTYGHGLNAVPEFVIHKFTSVNSNWYTYHKSIGQKYINLNDADGAATNQFTTAPTSSVFTYPSNLIVGPNYPVVAYSFTSVAGYSAFGSYPTNGSADGPFVYTGFRPRWALLKESSSNGELWVIYDTERNPFNVMGKQLYPALNAAEADATASTHARIDFLSNGFKIRGSHSSINTNGETVIYAAFAEHPFKTARAR